MPTTVVTRPRPATVSPAPDEHLRLEGRAECRSSHPTRAHQPDRNGERRITMAKKPSRSGRPQPGGRVTPKGVRPAGSGAAHQDGPASAAPTASPAPKHAPVQARRANTMHAPTRAGHHRGQR